jgi:hypothetical protein
MTVKDAEFLIQSLKAKGVQFEAGLTDNEFSQIESLFQIKFPPDLLLFLQLELPISTKFVNWRKALSSSIEKNIIHERLDGPLEGILFDIEHNNFWFDSWGAKPEKYEDQVKIATRYYHEYPKLIPIFAHRYIPDRPNKMENPVFSVHQTDIIYYGYNLATYLSNEFAFPLPAALTTVEHPDLNIEFWSSITDNNHF